MRIVCISDSEIDSSTLRKWLVSYRDILKSADRIVHLGDGVGNIKNSLAGYKVDYIKGNHDDPQLINIKSRVIRIGKINVLLTHGIRDSKVKEKLNIWQNYIRRIFKLEPLLDGYYNDLFQKYEGKYGIVLYGHMHTPRIDLSKNTVFFCPGSFSYKNSLKEGPSLGVIDISEKESVFSVLVLNIKSRKIIKAFEERVFQH